MDSDQGLSHVSSRKQLQQKQSSLLCQGKWKLKRSNKVFVANRQLSSENSVWLPESHGIAASFTALNWDYVFFFSHQTSHRTNFLHAHLVIMFYISQNNKTRETKSSQISISLIINTYWVGCRTSLLGLREVKSQKYLSKMVSSLGVVAHATKGTCNGFEARESLHQMMVCVNEWKGGIMCAKKMWNSLRRQSLKPLHVRSTNIFILSQLYRYKSTYVRVPLSSYLLSTPTGPVLLPNSYPSNLTFLPSDTLLWHGWKIVYLSQSNLSVAIPLRNLTP